MKIAACMIVKNSENTIERCLESIRPYVDGVFVYDTGSTDATVTKLEEINEKRWIGAVNGMPDGTFSEELEQPASDGGENGEGERGWFPLAPVFVEQGKWRDDFAWARAQSFEMPGDDFDWVIWLDDDDIIDGAHNLRMLAAQATSDIDGFVFQYDYARDEHGNTVCVLWRERLLRRDRGYTWTNPVHEVLIPPEGKPARFSTVMPNVVRYIHNRPADRYSPNRNLDILRKHAKKTEKAGTPVDQRTLAYLGTELMAHGDWAAAAPYLQRYLDHPEPGWSDERMQVAHKLACCARALGNPLASISIEMDALRERDDWPETYVGLSETFAMLQRWDRVERWAKRAVELGTPQTPLIVNPLEFTLLPQLRLAEACQHMGRFDEAEQWLTRAAAAAPNHPAVADRIRELAQAKLQGEALRALLTVREVLVRHDENEKAYRLMETAVPYIVSEHPEVVKARSDQREMVAHMLRPEEYLRWYEDEPKESTITDDMIDQACVAFGRVQGLMRGLAEQEEQLGRKPRVLDLGCNDWWMGEYLARHGYQCDGVELNKRSFEKAIERRDRFERDALIVQGDLHHAERLLNEGLVAAGNEFGATLPPNYDAVVMYEVLEHVPDVDHTLSTLESLVAPGGRVYLSTPNGAFEQGQLPTWARVERKGHLRAIPIHDLAAMLQTRGNIEDLEHTNGDRVAFASYTPTPRKGTVVFYAGGQWEPWSPQSIRQGGLGGSETALVQVATRFAADGYGVRVYSGAEPGYVAGVLYRPFTAWDPTEDCDLLIVSRRPDVFDNPVGARKTALWCHDHSYDSLTPERADRIDHIVVLSDWQRERFERLYPHATEKLTVIRNGITWRDFSGTLRYPDADRSFADRKPRAVFSSSADRGLDVLLDLWPRIRDRVPDAELHVFYGFNVLDRVAAVNPQLAAFKQAIMAKVDELGGKKGGVHLRGRVGQVELAKEMQHARVLAYPTAFLETSCISAMEAQAAGLPIVTSRLGALAETATGQTLISWSSDEDEAYNHDPAYQAAFVDEVVRRLTDPVSWTVMHGEALDVAESFDWAGRMPDWQALLAPAAVRELAVA